MVGSQDNRPAIVLVAQQQEGRFPPQNTQRIGTPTDLSQQPVSGRTKLPINSPLDEPGLHGVGVWFVPVLLRRIAEGFLTSPGIYAWESRRTSFIFHPAPLGARAAPENAESHVREHRAPKGAKRKRRCTAVPGINAWAS